MQHKMRDREELIVRATDIRRQLPPKIVPIEPPNNECNGYWKWCPICGHEFLFPGDDHDPPTRHCAGCGAEVAWKPEQHREPNIDTKSDATLREYVAGLKKRIMKRVPLAKSSTGNYFKECTMCKYQFVSPGSATYPRDDYCEGCGAEVIWPRE